MAKTRRQKQKEEQLKSKNTGVGLKISIDSSASNKKKITFDDDDNIVDEIPPVAEEVVDTGNDPSEEDNDDDDDMVEEVQGQTAREEILEQLQSEEKQSLRSKKKRKKRERKPREEEEDEDDEDFDEEFFAQLEAAKAQEKEKLEKKRGKGKHTAFVFAQDDNIIDERPREADHNIQVVVLKDPSEDSTLNAITAVPTNALSNDALIFSRSRLINGSDGIARGATGKKRKWQVDTTWKRSKKMNHLMAARSRASRRKGRGMAAANFVKKR